MEGKLSVATLFLAVIVTIQCKSFVAPSIDDKHAESNRFVDNLLATVRTHPNMTLFDPLKLNFHRQDMIDGHFILTNGTATGLSTLHRHEKCEACDVQFNIQDQTLTIKTVIVTNNIQVTARLQAETNQGHTAEGRVYGTMHMLSFAIEILVDKDGNAKLQDYKLEFPLYLEPEYCSEETAQPALKGIIHESMYFGFSTKYGFDVGKTVTKDLRWLVKKLVSNTKFPIMG